MKILSSLPFNAKILIASALVSFASFAAEEETLPMATDADIAELTAACQQMAAEDQVEDADLPQYLLDCVNDQLTEMGYQTLTELK
ncbi:hypothetical protein LZP73_04075 [Shewanella sp. AS16]|uniref:hypothetical protein n=1 Tax=Shewanella sp. AS16 TaxID=2907625 RepID=UPI001F3EE07D|nr:hypothetical protein [Shewanella sp. AS16]MCE9685394.1 hypothetical protein [Shewanella sp. AS16]